jgi:hypothetical protein
MVLCPKTHFKRPQIITLTLIVVSALVGLWLLRVAWTPTIDLYDAYDNLLAARAAVDGRISIHLGQRRTAPSTKSPCFISKADNPCRLQTATLNFGRQDDDEDKNRQTAVAC